MLDLLKNEVWLQAVAAVLTALGGIRWIRGRARNPVVAAPRDPATPLIAKLDAVIVKLDALIVAASECKTEMAEQSLATREIRGWLHDDRIRADAIRDHEARRRRPGDV